MLLRECQHYGEIVNILNESEVTRFSVAYSRATLVPVYFDQYRFSNNLIAVEGTATADIWW